MLLEILYNNYDSDKERVKCEDSKEGDQEKNPIRCSITFNNTVRLNYSFVNEKEFMMYPQKIEGFEKVGGAWKSWVQINYLNFSALFTGKPIIDRALPIGFGCRRVRSQSYPKMQTNYGDRFELLYDVEFRYWLLIQPRISF